MEGAGDFFVKENIAHGLENVRVKANGEFTNVARAVIGIEYLVEALCIVTRGLDDLPVFEY